MKKDLFALSPMNRDDSEHEPEENIRPKDDRELTLVDAEMFFDLLMEEQEQM